MKLCNGRVGGWGLLWQVSLDFILQLSVVPLFACADFRSTMSLLYMIFCCCFGCFVEFVFTIIFSFLCCNMWNNLAVNDLEVFAVAFSSDDLLALFQFDACRLSLLARQVRLYICCCSSLRNQHHWMIGLVAVNNHLLYLEIWLLFS